MPKISSLALQAKKQREKEQTALEPTPKLKKTARRKRAEMFLDEVAKRELQMLCVEQGKSQQALMVEALNLLFEAYGKTAIAK